MNDKIIGLSLSFCVRDIAEGHIKEELIDKIISGTKAKNEHDWQGIFDDYVLSYWMEFPEEAVDITRRFIDADKIEQPRVHGELESNIAMGHWLVDGKQGFFYKGQFLSKKQWLETWHEEATSG